MNYFTEKLGKILSTSWTFDSENGAGWHLYVKDDTAGSTGGYYIYFAPPNMDTTKPTDFKQYKYNNWAQNKEELEASLRRFEIEWIETIS